MNELAKIPELDAIEPSKAEQIKATFDPMAEMLAQFESKYNKIIQESKEGITGETTAKAKSLRVAIAKVRIETEKTRKAQKEEYLRAGKAIDGVANILKWAVKDKEDKLREIENYFEIQEQKRLEELQAKRVKQISKYLDDADERDLASMDDDVWKAFYNSKKMIYEERLAAEKKAEKERIAREKAEAEERERIRKENEKLRKEKEAAEEKAKREAEKKEREYQKKLEEERRERERLAKIEAEKRAKLEAEIRAREEAERKRIEEERVKLEAEKQKGDSERMQDFISELESLTTKYKFKSEKYAKVYVDAITLIHKTTTYIRGKL